MNPCFVYLALGATGCLQIMCIPEQSPLWALLVDIMLLNMHSIFYHHVGSYAPPLRTSVRQSEASFLETNSDLQACLSRWRSGCVVWLSARDLQRHDQPQW